MAVQGATLASGTSPLRPTRPITTKTNLPTQLYCSRGLRLPSASGKYALNSALGNGGVSLLALSGARGPPRITMRLASKQAYICRDCGYIYSDRTPFEKLPDDFYCPVCAAPKRRFRPYEKSIAKNANETSVRKARKEDLKKEEDAGNFLPAAIALGAVGLLALYFYLNSQL